MRYQHCIEAFLWRIFIFMRPERLLFTVLLIVAVDVHALGPATKANDDSCDVALQPAATLLLPYFEVDLGNLQNQNTLFSITNVTNVSRIARVTLWTDYAYPIMTFNIYLTGYDVQSISLYDVIANGIIGSGSGTGTSASHTGQYSDPNAELDLDACASLPGAIPARFVTLMQEALLMGRVSGVCNAVGNVHERAIGYATIDVVGNCSSATPADPVYFSSDIRYDNVLAGDYQQVSGTERSAQISPMVHIRAIPEGGTPASRAENPGTYANRFSRTFYGRYQGPGMFNSDARQPLPSRFATRWISGGNGGFDSSFKIWRQSVTGSDIRCGQLARNGLIRGTDSVMFDENENGEGTVIDECNITCIPSPPGVSTPATSRPSIEDTEVFPQAIRTTVTSGWIYLNLDDDDMGNGAQQAWVVTSMRASGIFSGDMDAIALGNGCSMPVARSEVSEGNGVIGPSPNGEPEP